MIFVIGFFIAFVGYAAFWFRSPTGYNVQGIGWIRERNATWVDYTLALMVLVGCCTMIASVLVWAWKVLP